MTGEAEGRTDPLTGLQLLKEEDEIYRKIKGIKEASL